MLNSKYKSWLDLVLKSSVIVFVLSPVLFFVILLIHPYTFTNVRFRSSDGKWADVEVVQKGRVFLNIVVLFELYKIACDRPDSTLQRLTDKPRPGMFSIGYWLNDFSSAKWLVPMPTSPKLAAEADLPIIWDHCARRGFTEAEQQLALVRAKKYIEDLGAYNQ